MKKIILLFLSLTLSCLIVMSGCTGHYVTTFTPEKEPPRRLDMNYQGPRANIAVGDFRVKARGATQYIGDGLREILAGIFFGLYPAVQAARMDPVAALRHE